MDSETTREPEPQPKVSIALPEGSLRRRLLDLLGDADVDVEKLAPDADLRSILKSSNADVVVVRRSQIRSGGEAIIDELAQEEEAPEVVVLSAEESPGERSRLLSAGVTSVLNVDVSEEELQDKIERLAAVAAEGGLDGPEVRGNTAEPRLADFLSRSPRMERFIETVRQVVDTDSSLLITGETGVGKERLARAIHAESARCDGPFVSVNCGALSENLLESELFGHEKGAFTGADDKRRGRFELAEKGTIFLDEIGDMPKQLQVKLLTVLQRHEVQRLGSEQTIRVDVRVMAATNRDLAGDVSAGRFREDLFYRLNVMPLEIPPLRERREDLPDLVGSFIRYFRESLGKDSIEGISDEALQVLLSYGFPGNIRELINVIERAMLLAKGTLITLSDLPEGVTGLRDRSRAVATSEAGPRAWSADGASVPENWLDRPLREARQAFLASFEEGYLRGLLEKTGGVVGETARLAGMTTRSLYDKMKRYGLRKEDFRR